MVTLERERIETEALEDLQLQRSIILQKNERKISDAEVKMNEDSNADPMLLHNVLFCVMTEPQSPPIRSTRTNRDVHPETQQIMDMRNTRQLKRFRSRLR